MSCDWTSFVGLLPLHLRRKVDERGNDKLLELRLRIGYPAELILIDQRILLDQIVTSDDINFCINTASRYSPWASTSISKGYITASGGHRLGICGIVTVVNGEMTGIRNVQSVCIRVAREFRGIAKKLAYIPHSVLIIGKPGSGKTTLLRDLIREKSEAGPGSIGVVDEKCELFPVEYGTCRFDSGIRTDVLSGCSKRDGIDSMLRNMGPSWIAVDEITSEEDCQALVRAGWCGVDLMATAHAANIHDLKSRTVYRPLISSGLFKTLAVIQADKSYQLERM